LRDGDHLEDPLVDGRIILKVMFEKWVGGMDWIDLAQDMVRRLVVVNERWGSIKCGEFLD
jgi:hypothetical protein